MITVFGSKVGDEEISQISEAIRNQWLGQGQKVSEFEQKFAQRLGLENFIMLDTGSNSLYMAVTLLDLPKQSEIILPSITWIACANAVLMAGHTPVFCDVDLKTRNLTAETIKPHINEKTKAIIVVHYAGKPADLDPIIELAKKHNLKIIEDAAHAVDSSYKGKPCVSIGEVGIYSFNEIKNISIGQGAGLTCKDRKLIERARKLRYCGVEKSGFDSAKTKNRWWEYSISEPFIKMRPTDVSAGIGLAQLQKLDSNQSHRKQIWERYQKAFGNIKWIETPQNPESYEKHSYFTYFINTKKRDELAHYLLEKGIHTTLSFYPLHLYKLYNSKEKLQNSEKIAETGLNIPLHPNLSDQDVDKVIGEIIEFGKLNSL